MTQNVIKKITENVYLLGDPFYQVYLVRGEVCALVETGLTYSVPNIVSQVAELGIPREEIRYLIITHAHFDHQCGTPGLQKAFPNLQVLASPIAARVLGKEKVVVGHFVEDKAVVETLLSKGLLKQYDTSFQPPATVDVDKIVDEGDILDLGGSCKLSFLLTPGHSPCSMTTYLPLGEVLFPSDCLCYEFRNKDMFPMYLSSLADFLNSIKRLTNIEASILAFGHALVVEDKRNVRDYMQRALENTEQVHNFIVQAYQNNRSYENISRELFDRFYLDGLSIQSEANIKLCTDLIVRRSLEAANIDYTK